MVIHIHSYRLFILGYNVQIVKRIVCTIFNVAGANHEVQRKALLAYEQKIAHKTCTNKNVVLCELSNFVWFWSF